MRISILLYICFLVASCDSRKEVDMIITNTLIYTCDSEFSNYEAIAISNGEIIDMNSDEEISSNYKSKETVDAGGKYVYPGFIDAHCHFSGYALTKYMCDLKGTTSYNEVLNKVVEYEKTNELDWIYARGWDQNDWEVQEYPDNKELDSLFPDKPVILKRVDGHAILCNSIALQKAGIDNNTSIEGGIVEKNNGELTGILIDNATEPVEAIIPSLPDSISLKYLKNTEEECFSYGLTGVVDCGVKGNIIDKLKRLYHSNDLHIGNYILLSQDSATLAKYAKQGVYKKGQFSINGIKMYADGALGSRGAALLKPYHDMPGHYGLILSNKYKMYEIAAIAKGSELQLCTHAIGDSANRSILRLYSEFLKSPNDKRWRIEHAQVVDNEDFKYYTYYNIIPSVQPTHAISDMPWAVKRLGENRLPSAYAYKTLMEQNGWLPLGTDFPVEGINPLATFYTAVYRKDKKGNPETGFLPENALSRKEALKGMTIWAAKSVFRENEKGSLEIGKHADFVILDKNIMECEEQEIIDTKVISTYIKGKRVYKNR